MHKIVCSTSTGHSSGTSNSTNIKNLYACINIWKDRGCVDKWTCLLTFSAERASVQMLLMSWELTWLRRKEGRKKLLHVFLNILRMLLYFWSSSSTMKIFFNYYSYFSSTIYVSPEQNLRRDLYVPYKLYQSQHRFQQTGS